MNTPILIPAERLSQSVRRAFEEAAASEDSIDAAVKALMHASRIGIDSHGVRLTEHYCTVLRSGRIKRRPAITVRHTGAATAIVDGDDALGHLVGYRAMNVAIEIARKSGIGAVGAVRSSHFGAAGAYAIAAAEANMIGFATTNGDSIVAPFNGARAFHGTNPLAFAAPVRGEKPWLLDMATSSIPFNRVLLFRSLAKMLPGGVAADLAGRATRDAGLAEMLMPMGGSDFGFKGAALAGLATVLAAVLTGSALDHAMTPMVGTPSTLQQTRQMGHFFLAIDPSAFVGQTGFASGIQAYLEALRAVPATDGAGPVLAPGDREWLVEAERLRDGIPVDPDTARFLQLSTEF